MITVLIVAPALCGQNHYLAVIIPADESEKGGDISGCCFRNFRCGFIFFFFLSSVWSHYVSFGVVTGLSLFGPFFR